MIETAEWSEKGSDVAEVMVLRLSSMFRGLPCDGIRISRRSRSFMRCARCDQIMLRESLGRSREGSLVFGWCRNCLITQDCVAVEPLPVSLTVRERPSWRRRFRNGFRKLSRGVKVPRARAGSRRLAILGIAGLMSAWALILAFVGGIKLGGPNRLRAVFWLCAAGLMAMMSLGAWLGVLGRENRRRVGLRIVQVASATVSLGTLAWGIAQPQPKHTLNILAGVFVGFLVSWVAHRYEKRWISESDRVETTLL